MPVIFPDATPQILVERAPKSPFWTRTSWVLALLLAGATVLFFWQLGAYGLIDVDEGRYAEVPREMLVSGDWLTPRLNFIAFFDKPPLLYWGIAASYQVFGVTEWAARLIPTLAALLGMVAAYGLGRRMFGPRAGFLSALILATSLMWPIMARLVLTDMIVSSLVFCALATWWLAISDSDVRRRRGYLALFWTSLGMGMLAKGPVALVLCGGAIFWYLLICKRWSLGREMGWSWGVPLLILVAAPWFVAVALRNPEFNRAFWFEQNIGRFTGAIAKVDHSHGPFFLFQFLPLIFFPWSVFALPALLYGWKRLWPARSAKRRAAVFLMGAAAWVLLFFSVSEGKLVTYILPILPLLAILMAAYFDSIWERPLGARASGLHKARSDLFFRQQVAGAGPKPALLICAALLSLTLIIGGIAAWFLAPTPLEKAGASTTLAHLAAIALGAWGLALGWTIWKRDIGALVGATAGGFALCFLVGISVVAAIMPSITTKPLIAAIQNGLRPDTEILAIGFSQSLPFYTGQRMRVAGTPDELAFGKAHLSEAERARWFFEVAPDLRRLMLTQTPTYCVIRRNNWQEEAAARALQNTSNQVFEIARNDRFLIIGNAAAARLTPPTNPNLSRFARLRRWMETQHPQRAKESLN